MSHGQEAPQQIETVHCLVINRVYFLYLFHLMKRKDVYFSRGFTFWNEYDMISLVYLIGDVSTIPNTFYHKYFGYIRVLARLKNSAFSAD